jgi:hypothetical protein
VLRIFGPKENEMEGIWRKLHNGEFHNSSSIIIRMIMSRRMRWEGHVARMGYKRKKCRALRVP